MKHSLELMNTAQRTSITIVLKIMEENLHRASCWLEAPPEAGILFRYELDISEEGRTKAREEIAEALELIAQIAESLELEPVEEDLGGQSAVR